MAPPQTTPLLAGIEAGGTKFVLAVGAKPTEITARHEISTREPDVTFAEAAEWFAGHDNIVGLGIGTFGPARIDPLATDWGHILATPKPGWSNCDFAGFFASQFNVRIGFDTDVNAAAIAEHAHGAGARTSGMAYVTVGTGIGGGLIIDGKVVHGAGHPEMGHLFPRRNASDQAYQGNCPYHGDCMEGLASGPAILARWGNSLSALPASHEAHDLVAGYLAQLCHTLFASCAIERVVLGGGVTKTPGLVGLVDEKAKALGAKYLPGRQCQSVVAPELGENSGITGALLLAAEALHSSD